MLIIFSPSWIISRKENLRIHFRRCYQLMNSNTYIYINYAELMTLSNTFHLQQWQFHMVQLYIVKKKKKEVSFFPWINFLKLLNTVRMMYIHLTVLPYATASPTSTLFLLIHCHSISSLPIISVQPSKNRKLCLLFPVSWDLLSCFYPEPFPSPSP